MVRTKCEVYSRVVGYIRPVEQWHDGKQAEFSNRAVFNSGVELSKKEKDSKQSGQTVI